MSTLSRLLEIGEGSEHVPRVALGYLVGLSAAEVTTVLFHTQLGLVLHGILLVTLMLHSALTWEQPGHKLLFSLAFAPLIRMLSLSLPMVGLPLLYWYLVTSVPLMVASVVAIRTLGFSWAGVGVNLRALPIQLLVGLTGLGFGYIEYQILKPPALARALTWDELWRPILILMFSTGFLEELIFRGMMQRAATEALGRFGLPYVAVLFAVLHVGYLSVLDVVFVLIVGFFFGWVAARTRSIVGVTLSHGLTNIVLFLVVPLSPVFNPPETPLAPGTPVPLPATPTPAVTVPVTPTVGPTVTPAAAPTPSPTPSATVTAAVIVSATPTTGPTAAPTRTPTATSLPTSIPAPTATNSPTSTAVATKTPTVTPSPTPPFDKLRTPSPTSPRTSTPPAPMATPQPPTATVTPTALSLPQRTPTQTSTPGLLPLSRRPAGLGHLWLVGVSLIALGAGLAWLAYSFIKRGR